MQMTPINESNQSQILHYDSLSLPVDDQPVIEWDYPVSSEDILWALGELGKLPEDTTDDEDLENISDYMENYEMELLDYFRDKAIEDAIDKYEPYEPDWDSMPGGHDDY